jgi:PAB-dependent poly(A)-specific ribonuclease subunit 2
VSSEEALSFNHSWKVPSVVTFQVKHANNKIDNSWKNNIDTSLLYQDFK